MTHCCDETYFITKISKILGGKVLYFTTVLTKNFLLEISRLYKNSKW